MAPSFAKCQRQAAKSVQFNRYCLELGLRFPAWRWQDYSESLLWMFETVEWFSSRWAVWIMVPQQSVVLRHRMKTPGRRPRESGADVRWLVSCNFHHLDIMDIYYIYIRQCLLHRFVRYTLIGHTTGLIFELLKYSIEPSQSKEVLNISIDHLMRALAIKWSNTLCWLYNLW